MRDGRAVLESGDGVDADMFSAAAAALGAWPLGDTDENMAELVTSVMCGSDELGEETEMREMKEWCFWAAFLLGL